MTDTQFHETRMGRTFYEHTLPKLVEQLERLNKNLERVAVKLELAGADAAPPPASDANTEPDEHRD